MVLPFYAMNVMARRFIRSSSNQNRTPFLLDINNLYIPQTRGKKGQREILYFMKPPSFESLHLV